MLCEMDASKPLSKSDIVLEIFRRLRNHLASDLGQLGCALGDYATFFRFLKQNRMDKNNYSLLKGVKFTLSDTIYNIPVYPLIKLINLLPQLLWVQIHFLMF